MFSFVSISCRRNAACSIVIVFAVLIFLSGCSHVNDGMVRGRRAVNALMDRAEMVVNNDPAYADSLMRRIDSYSIYNREQRARYALLYTEAKYKNYQPMTSDSLIMEAVRFYSISNNLDYRFLSYYYLGCVYSELERFADASVALAQAEQLVDRISNEYWKGLLYTQLGNIFSESCDYKRAEDFFVKAASCYEHADKEHHRMRALYDIAHCEKNLLQYTIADSISRIVQRWAFENNKRDLYLRCLKNRFSCYLFMNENDSAVALYNNYISKVEEPERDPYFLELMALYYNMLDDYSQSELYLNKAWNCSRSCTDSIYCYYISSILAESKGQMELSLECYQKYISLQNSDLRKILMQPILGAQNEHFRVIAENELLKSNHARMTLILCAVIFLLIIVIVFVTYYYKKKRMEEQLFDSLAVVEELTDRIERLKNQVRIQFHERHDISNRLYSMYFDSESQEKVTKQQLKVTINSLIKEYTAADSIRKIDSILNESYDGIMEKLTAGEMGLSNKELQLLRFSFAGLSSKSVSVIIKDSPQNIYQIKSRLLKKVRKNSEELWMSLNDIL